jgi:hypothetical protein
MHGHALSELFFVLRFAQLSNVMAGLVPAIHAAPQRQIVVGCAGFIAWTPAT